MKIKIGTTGYNERRYGKPWIATVDFPNSKGDFTFGEWVGQHGAAGLLIIDVKPGDVIAVGQKDLRKPANSASRFFLVPDDAPEQIESDSTRELVDVGFAAVSKAEAYQHHQARITRDRSTDYTGLMDEREALLARVAEIDAIIGAATADLDLTK